MSNKISRPRNFNQYTYIDKEGRHVCIVTTKYHGKLLRGTATCASTDEYKEDVGLCLAQRRCEAKYYKAKLNNATKKINELSKATDAALDLAKMLIEKRKEALEYASDSTHQMEETEKLLEDLLVEVQ